MLGSTGALVQVLTAPSFGFNDPIAISSDRIHVWVTSGDTTVVELSASTGAVIRYLGGSSY
jgi:hypothetical protein